MNPALSLFARTDDDPEFNRRFAAANGGSEPNGAYLAVRFSQFFQSKIYNPDWAFDMPARIAVVAGIAEEDITWLPGETADDDIFAIPVEKLQLVHEA